VQSAKLTAEEFERLLPRLGRQTVDTAFIVRRVLVDGVPQSDVAREVGLTRQRVSKLVQIATAAFEEIPREWERVEEWLPPDLAAQVREMAKVARQKVKKDN